MKHLLICSTLVILLGFIVVGCQKEKQEENQEEKWPDWEEIDRIEAAVVPVCEGHPIAEAAAYHPGTTQIHHPLAQVRIDENPPEMHYVNPEAPWSPKKVAQTQLVACVQYTYKELRKCNYTVLGSAKYQHVTVIIEKEIVTIRVLRAQDATLVKEVVFEGENLNTCTQWTKLSGDRETIFDTGTVKWDDIKRTLQSLNMP